MSELQKNLKKPTSATLIGNNKIHSESTRTFFMSK